MSILLVPSGPTHDVPTLPTTRPSVKNNVEVTEYCGRAVSKDPGLVDAELVIAAGFTQANATPDQLHDAEDAARERVLVCAFLTGSDRIRYRKLLEELENDYTQAGQEQLPVHCSPTGIQPPRTLEAGSPECDSPA
jgi:hypothetical protein